MSLWKDWWDGLRRKGFSGKLWRIKGKKKNLLLELARADETLKNVLVGYRTVADELDSGLCGNVTQVGVKNRLQSEEKGQKHGIFDSRSMPGSPEMDRGVEYSRKITHLVVGPSHRTVSVFLSVRVELVRQCELPSGGEVNVLEDDDAVLVEEVVDAADEDTISSRIKVGVRWQGEPGSALGAAGDGGG